ncbi:MAG: cytochrome c [Terracidiphilus sp.]
MTFQRSFFILCISVCVATMIAGCHAVTPLTTQEAEGKHLYEVRCAHCHEENDLALKKVPPDLHGVFKSAALPSGAPATDAGVRHVVLGGKGMMPAFNGRFDDTQMAALLAYLHTGLR